MRVGKDDNSFDLIKSDLVDYGEVGCGEEGGEVGQAEHAHLVPPAAAALRGRLGVLVHLDKVSS